MAGLYKRWEARSLFGDLAVLAFVLMQGLDGAFTYLGIRFWGAGIEANALVTSTVHAIGLGAGIASLKLIATAFGVMLHLQRVHNLVALLTVMYFALAILPWTAVFLTN